MTLQNQGAITQFLAGKGLTAAQIAGVEGNLQIESSGRPEAYNAKEGAIGVAQWEGGRRTALQSFARGAGTSETDLTTQLNFLWQELQTTERGAMSALLSATTPADAATAFQSKYERSSTASLPARVSAANAIAAGGVQGGSGQVQTGGATASPAGFTASPAGFLDGLAGLTGADLGRWIIDGAMILVGVSLVIVGFIILAKSGGGSAPQQPVVDLVQRSGKGAKAGAADAAEDAAVVAG